MDVDADDEVLCAVAQGGTMEYSKWPGILERLIPRLQHIARHEFPLPRLPPDLVASVAQPAASSQSIPATQDTTSTAHNPDKENEPPSSTAPSAALPTAPPPSAARAESSDALPPPLLILLDSIITTLQTYFSEVPPHTIQRLAELVLSPKQHYRSLTSYLHAVDRVVHVTSGANIYPLPAAVPEPAGTSCLSNGVTDRDALSWSSSAAQATLGSDESLGGALLTPIPWLRTNNGSRDGDAEVRTESTETIDGPNGAGSVETVSVSINGVPSHTAASDGSSLRAEGGVTQGELLRQEQEAGVIPVSQLAAQQQHADEADDEDETPHARGPQEIGMEDMGPQGHSNSDRGAYGMEMQGIDVEAAVGRKAEHERSPEVSPAPSADEPAATPKREADEEMQGDDKRVKEDGAGSDSDADEMDGVAPTREAEAAVDEARGAARDTTADDTSEPSETADTKTA